MQDSARLAVGATPDLERSRISRVAARENSQGRKPVENGLDKAVAPSGAKDFLAGRGLTPLTGLGWFVLLTLHRLAPVATLSRRYGRVNELRRAG